MKNPSGSVKSRRTAVPKDTPKTRVRLDLKRSSKPEPEEKMEIRQESHFWRWVWLIALLHVLVICAITVFYAFASSPKQPEQFISLLPEGDVVKGNPGIQEAHKVGPTTPASAAHHSAAPPPPPASAKPKPVITPAKPPPVALDKPNPLAPPKPAPPKPPKVKVDLNLVDGPTPKADKPKPKPHLKKPQAVLRPDDDSTDNNRETSAKPDSTGLSKEQIAAKLGEKLDAAGVKNATQTGKTGSTDSHANTFADFYASIRDQVMNQWESPNLIDETAVNPIVQIHVEKDGRVPPESVRLIQSSGNSTYDNSAVTAAKNLGCLHEPLPDGCPPDIPITFKLTR
jgi:TonB family protein